jgi:hypothetical protein
MNMYLFFGRFVCYEKRGLAMTSAEIAQCVHDKGMPTDLGCLPADYAGFTAKLYGWGLWLLGFIAVIFLMIGGYQIMMSRGNVEMLERGKSFVFYSIAGLLLAIFGFVFIEIISGQILKIPGFGS